jgi:hypothetical protein
MGFDVRNILSRYNEPQSRPNVKEYMFCPNSIELPICAILLCLKYVLLKGNTVKISVVVLGRRVVWYIFILSWRRV